MIIKHLVRARALGLLPARKDALHGFTSDVLNAHFAGVSLSPHESEAEMKGIITNLGHSRRFYLQGNCSCGCCPGCRLFLLAGNR